MENLSEKVKGILVDKGLIARDQLNNALAIQRKRGGRLEPILTELGYDEPQRLSVALRENMTLTSIDLSRLIFDKETLNTIPKKIARLCQFFPVAKKGDTLTVAVSNPLDILLLGSIEPLSHYEIIPTISTEDQIRESIEKYYGSESYDEIKDILTAFGEPHKVEIVTREEEEAEKIDSATLRGLIEEAPVVKLVNKILVSAVKERASDILIEPFEDELRVRYRVDGALRKIPSPPKRLHNAIISRLKILAGLNIAERRLPQDGRFKIELEGRMVNFRVSALPSCLGERMVLRVLDKATVTLDIDKLGFDPLSLGVLKENLLQPHGMILICGPTGSGKTTTLYSALKYIDSIEKNLTTVEDPIEYQLYGINQVPVQEDIGMTFASALRSILRQDPDIILVGEIRDFETADIAVKSALTGHLVLSTLHTHTASGAIVRLINMGVEPFLIASSCLIIGAQALVRRLCPKCKETYPAPEAILEEIAAYGLGGSGDVFLYRGKGCKACNNTGYWGRTGMLETLPLTPSIKKLIIEGDSEVQIRKKAREEGMVTLRQSGLANALKGDTSLEEVLRVIAAD